MDRMSAGKAMIETLEQFGIERVFGIPGHHILDLYNHLDESKIDHVMGKNEEGVVRSANAAARATGKPAVALVSAGPGAINGMTGVGEANALSLPLVVIAGAEPTRDGPHNVDESMAVPNMFTDIAKEHLFVDHPPDVLLALKRAFTIVTEGKPGPVVVQVPMDVMKSSIHVDSFPTQPTPTQLQPTEAPLEEVADVIDDVDRPFIVMGQGALRADIPGEIESLASKIGAPVVVTQRGFSGYVDKPTYAGGFTPTMQHIPAEEVVSRGELYVGIGMREGLRRYYNAECDSNAIYLLERLERHNLDSPTVVGDLQSSVTTLSNDCNEQSQDWWIDMVRDGWNKEETRRENILSDPTDTIAERPSAESEPEELLEGRDALHPVELIAEINDHKEADAVVTTDVGVHTTYAMRYLDLTDTNSFFGPENWGAMGHALPSALGANIALPERQVIAIAGDGGFLMTMAEFQTAVEEQLDLTVVIYNNHQHNAIYADQLDQYGNTDFTGVPGFDYALFAESAGGKGFAVQDSDDLGTMIEKALDSDVPSIVDVPVVPNMTLA